MTTNDTDKQPEPLHGPNLVIDVENFGPIAEAKNIEFKPMTVFVGPSNTGKTYLATLAHAFFEAANSDEDPIAYRAISNFRILTSSPDRFYTHFVRDVARWAFETNSNNTDRKRLALNVPIDAFSTETRDYIIHAATLALRVIGKRTNDEIVDYFDLWAIEDRTREAIIDYFDAEHQYQSSNDDDTYEAFSAISLSFARHVLNLTDHGRPQSTTQIDGAISIPWRYVDLWSGDEFDGTKPRVRRNQQYVDRVLERYIADQFRIIPRSFYLPTGRTGIMNAHRVLASQIVKRAHRFGLDTQDKLNYHRLARDFLTLLIDLGDNTERIDNINSSRFVSASNVISSSLVEGEINVTVPKFGPPDFEYVRDGITTPMFRASSMVTELAPILMVLRHYARKGNVLIIDEPEAHLHPAAQQQMAAALAFMVRSGLRVLITTHSHYMVEQLGNFVAVSTLDPDLRKRALKLKGALGQEDIYLDESEVAVYDFATDKAEHGSIVETVDFNSDSFGYFPRDHNWAIADQMNRTQRVIETMVDSERTASRK